MGSIAFNNSPLRYPGGKGKITPLIKAILKRAGVKTYLEPFAGGAGVAINLLLSGAVENIVLNDYDKAIYSFWRALKEETDELLSLLKNTPVTVEEWHNQRAIYRGEGDKYSLRLGFATLYLNRTNHSGILGANPIGGLAQGGKYKINARFNKETLRRRIIALGKRKNSIKVYNKEIRAFVKQVGPLYRSNALAYFDPPYYVKGKRLYKNFFAPHDHAEIAGHITAAVECDWVITYDDTPEIREIYGDYPMYGYELSYSAASRSKGAELLILKDRGLMPPLDCAELSKFEIRVAEDRKILCKIISKNMGV